MHLAKWTVFLIVSGSLALLTLAACGSERSGSKGALSVGKAAPELSGVDHRGNPLDLRKLSTDSFVLVYFYPKDNTPGCTKEACALRDVWKKYSDAKVTVIGVSRDSAEKHRQFADEHQLPFSLIADEDGAWAAAFSVGKTFGMYQRKSFLIGPGGKVERVYDKVDPGLHARQVLEDVAALRTH